MRLLAIDAATRLGWCVRMGAPAQILFGSYQLSRDAAPAVRWLEYWAFLGKTIDEHGIDTLGVEAPLPRKSLDQTTLAFGYYAVASMVAYRRRLRFLEAVGSSVKKHFTGFGAVPSFICPVPKCTMRARGDWPLCKEHARAIPKRFVPRADPLLNKRLVIAGCISRGWAVGNDADAADALALADFLFAREA